MCMFCHGLFKRYVGHNQKLNIFVWGMRSIVIVLNLFPIYLMNNVSDISIGKSGVCGSELWKDAPPQSS